MTVPIENVPPKDCDIKLQYETVKIHRHAAGSWTLTIRIIGSIRLLDERMLHVRRDVAVGSVIQTGRKPQELPNR